MPDPLIVGLPDDTSISPSSPLATTVGAPAADTLGSEQVAHLEDEPPPSSTIGDQAKQKLTGAVEGQKGAAADLVQNFAKSVHNAGEQFEGQQDWIASAIQRAATELDNFATSLRDKSIGDIAGQAQTFARQQPALFVGASLVLGFAAARLSKVVVRDGPRSHAPSQSHIVPESSHAEF